MTSDKQISANQQNSLKSTGPRSGSGKAIVAQNAIKHGILSAKIAMDQQEREDFCNFASQMQAYFTSTNSLEELLIDRIISNIWRLRRVIHIETLMLKDCIRNDWETKSYQGIFENNSGTAMATLSRYEKSLEHSLYRSLKELREMRTQTEINVNAFIAV